MRIFKIAVWAVPAAMLLSSTAQGASLTVTNPSFETLPAGGLPSSCGTGCAYDVGALPGWTSTGVSGQFQPGAPGFTTYFNTRASDNSITIADSVSGTISQTVANVVQLNVVYTLMVDLGLDKASAFGGSADLLINGTKYAATGVAPTSGNWATYTATYTGLSADVGKAITIELNASGPEGDFDNVRLNDSTVSATPEPASLALVGCSLLLIQRLRRKRTSAV